MEKKESAAARQTPAQEPPRMPDLADPMFAEPPKSPQELNCGFLNKIYKTCESALTSIDTVVKKTEDDAIKRTILAQYEDYDRFSKTVASHITRCGETPKKTNALSKATMWGSISLQALIDNSPSHIAEMMIQGSNMGILTINREINQQRSCVSKESLQLAEDLLAMMQKNIEDLKPYL